MAAKVEIEIEKVLVPVYEESKILCQAMKLDPMGVISSGSLLISAPPSDAEKIIKAAQANAMSMTKIGRVVSEGSSGVTLLNEGKREPLPYFERDEITKIF